MKWRKLGLVYAPSGTQWWAKNYAILPTVDVLDSNVLRIYFASLDAQRFGRIGYVDVDAHNPLRIVYETPEPIFDIGEQGAFDDSGVNPSCVITVGQSKYLYYIGWQRCERVPYMLFTGLAISHNSDGEFRRHKRIPILDRTNEEPFSRSAPFIMRDMDIYKVWYWSCQNWSTENAHLHYNNVIRCTQSVDGLVWDNLSTVCITPHRPDDYAVGRPWVIKENDKYRMWFSIRSLKEPYRIGYAESKDGIIWERLDEQVGIVRSVTGWDSEMICYPCVVDVSGRRYMFYNGNRHGSTGFGCAIFEG